MNQEINSIPWALLLHKVSSKSENYKKKFIFLSSNSDEVLWKHLDSQTFAILKNSFSSSILLHFSTPNNPLGENFTKSDKEIDESIR